jgi:hypothetical protein
MMNIKQQLDERQEHSKVMRRRASSALFFVSMMLLAGCTSSVEQEIDNEIDPIEVQPSSVEITWITLTNEVTLGDDARLSFTLQIEPVITVSVEPLIISPSISQITEFNWTQTSNIYNLQFTPDKIGDYQIKISIREGENSGSLLKDYDFLATITTLEAQQDAPLLEYPATLFLEEPDIVWIEGKAIHADVSSCTLKYTILGDEGTIGVDEDGRWKALFDFTKIKESAVVGLNVTCGSQNQKTSQYSIQVIPEFNTNDQDGDGVEDTIDRCPEGVGENDGWISSTSTDFDADGCRDFDEDYDDDNDGVIDLYDQCPDDVGWTSTPDSDHDSDGCHDANKDEDDDGDGVLDVNDLCPVGRSGWASNFYSDWDSDGCEDIDEDDNDDNDDYNDTVDDCPKGIIGWTASSQTDFDNDGCHDQQEDLDDDNDGVTDVNGTGDQLDMCPFTPFGAVDVDEFGCASVERDTDQDGVNDAVDQCPGTPFGNQVNAVGCADIDGDGVFSNVDQCPNSPQRWSVNAVGCAVIQESIPFTSVSTLNGPMQIVPQFSIPTLDGTYNFQNEWSGDDVYFFMFKYTDGSGNSNSGTWAQNPGTFIRRLPLNTQLFFGSFDSSYHSDVVNRKSAVLTALSSEEESHWNSRIHYIDMDVSNAQGGLGSIISSFNNPLYIGIDRFQQARETGSLYAWTTQSNDPKHLTYEPHQWNTEFPVKMRESDPAVEVVTIFDFSRHAGGWSSGFSSFSNATIDLDNEISAYDTLEVYHEHACFERKNRYQNSDGSYGGCHEWDYLANLYICEENNSSSCSTEMVRWITTYGREGQWLTDISPYLFMLDDGQDRRFKYGGANKGDLTVKFLFSNWGSAERSHDATYAFSGGQFDGTYNNESRYLRSLNFSVPASTTKVEIVATVTGHGFGKDNANCAEFCDHEHHYYLTHNSTQHTAYEWHPIVYSSEGCENEVNNGVVANQFGSWPFGRAGWCAGQDVKQWRYDISDWLDLSQAGNSNYEYTLDYRGLYNGQEYVPSDGVGNGERQIRAVIYVVFYTSTT